MRGTNQMIPHLGEASSAGTTARIASTAALKCSGSDARSMLLAMLSLFLSIRSNESREEGGKGGGVEDGDIGADKLFVQGPQTQAEVRSHTDG